MEQSKYLQNQKYQDHISHIQEVWIKIISENNILENDLKNYIFF